MASGGLALERIRTGDVQVESFGDADDEDGLWDLANASV